jgi:hypothetical protein
MLRTAVWFVCVLELDLEHQTNKNWDNHKTKPVKPWGNTVCNSEINVPELWQFLLLNTKDPLEE